MATIKFKLTEESPAHFIALANRTIEDLGWKVLGYSEKSLAASIGHSEYQSAYSNLRIVIQSNEVTLTCHNDLVIIAEESRNSSYLTRFYPIMNILSNGLARENSGKWPIKFMKLIFLYQH